MIGFRWWLINLVGGGGGGGGGAVSDFIQRYLHDNVGINWGQLKT